MIFREELERSINLHSMENGSNTPDYILAHFLCGCLAAFDQAAKDRDKWYHRDKEIHCPGTEFGFRKEAEHESD